MMNKVYGVKFNLSELKKRNIKKIGKEKGNAQAACEFQNFQN